MPSNCGKDGNIKVNLKDAMEIWKEHQEKLLNEENERSGELSVKAVMEALNLMKLRKAAGPSGVTSELLKICEDKSAKKFAEVADDLLQGKEMPEISQKSDLLPIYKG